MNAGAPPLRVGVIDADSGFVKVFAKRMESAGWQYRLLTTAIPPADLVAMKVNAIVFDPAVIDGDYWTYLEKITGLLPDLGVIVCSFGSSVPERVRGLRIGADDWVTKPCHPEEVMARVESVCRRRRRLSAPVGVGPVVVGEVEIRADQFQAFVSGQSLDLTRREFELVALLAERRGEVLPREAIYQGVWGYAMAHGDRSVDVFIRKLRQKLEAKSPGFTYIHTHFGVGYRFAAESVAGSEEPVAAAAPEHRLDEVGPASFGLNS